jgi:[ribosomal protein S5]-alanine N-acetyltransferase
MLKLEMPTLRTGRLILRPITEDDSSAMYAYASDPENLHFVWFPQHTSVENSRQVIREFFLNRPQRGLPEPYAIVEASSGTMIGTIDIHTVRFGDVGEMGYILNKAYWNRGYTTEALQALIGVAFHHCGFWRVEIQHHADNKASEAVIRKAGFIHEGTFRQRKFDEALNRRGDYCFYGINLTDEVVSQRYTQEHYEKTLSQ